MTERVTLLSCFANNLLRSPVEFAQAALALQRASGGRFEAGLGPGLVAGGDRGHRRLLPAAGGPGGALTPKPSGWSGSCSRPGGARSPASTTRSRSPSSGPRSSRRRRSSSRSAGRGRSARSHRSPIVSSWHSTPPPLAAGTRACPGWPAGSRPSRRPHRAGDTSRPGRAARIFLTVACGDDDLVGRLDRSGALGIPGWPARRIGSRPPCSSSSTTRIDRVQAPTPATSATLTLLAEHLPLAHRS